MRNRSGDPPPPAMPFPGSRGSPGAPPPVAPLPDVRGAADAPPPGDAAFPELWDAAVAPPPGPAPFPELLGTAEPAPAARSRGMWLLRLLARVALWSLIAVGALRGLLPLPEGLVPAMTGSQEGREAGSGGLRDGSREPGSGGPRHRNQAVGSGSTRDDPQGAVVAVAVAFLREYLTVGDDRATRAERLGQFTVAGADLRRAVSVPAGAGQYADLVVPAGSRSVAGGIEVTVLAHLLQLRSGAYRDGGTLAFVVPLAVGREGIAVVGRPRPTSLPVASGLVLARARTPPADLTARAARVARQAVVAFVGGDSATLARLGGGRVPSTRPFPSGWRALRVGAAEVGPPGAAAAPQPAGSPGAAAAPQPAGSPGAAATPEPAGSSGAVAAVVPVRVRPPTGPISYLVPVLVQLDSGPRGLTVRQVDAGGSP